MENDIDYRKELEEARRAAALCGRNGTEASLEAHWEVCCGDVLIAEANLRNQDRVWENAALARDLLDIAHFLEGYDCMLDDLHTALQRMREAVSDHPRLTIEILEMELTVIRRIEALCDHDMQAGEEVENELAYYRRNASLADKGQFSKIISKDHLNRDPVEWSAAYEKVIDEANRKTYALLENYPRGMGFCLAYWSTKAQVLKTCYGIDWKSPSVMNPSVMFD